jgi:hypothetical protein
MYRQLVAEKLYLNVTAVATKKKSPVLKVKLARGFILRGAGPQQHACPRTVKIACFFLGLFVNDIECPPSIYYNFFWII